MHAGAVTSYFDVAQITLYAFWIFFAGLIFYLRREDKREGFPMVAERPSDYNLNGFPDLPAPKAFILAHGETVYAPRAEAPEELVGAVPSASFPGAPLVPTGNPMIDGVGPAAWARRSDHPDLGWEDGKPKIVPLRVATEYSLALEDPELIGWAVVGADGVVAGTVVDVWIDRAETIIRYLEVALIAPLAARTILLPSGFGDIKRKAKEIRVFAILGAQFGDVPALRNPDQVTLLEEDKLSAYFAGGLLYATPQRAEPLL